MNETPTPNPEVDRFLGEPLHPTTTNFGPLEERTSKFNNVTNPGWYAQLARAQSFNQPAHKVLSQASFCELSPILKRQRSLELSKAHLVNDARGWNENSKENGSAQNSLKKPKTQTSGAKTRPQVSLGVSK